MSGSREDAYNKLMRARCRLMTKEPWYGHMAMSIEWRQSDMAWNDDPEQRTLGFKINAQGIVQAFYNPEWVMKADLREIYGTIEHSINHLVRLHTLRLGGREEEVWYIACDMAVNGKRSNPHIGYKEETGVVILPHKDMVFVPKDWPEDDAAEQYYERIAKDGGDGKGKNKGKGQNQNQNQQSQGGQGPGQGQQGQGGSDSPPGHYEGKHGGHAVDDHQSWKQSDISQDEARQVIHDMAKEAADKSQGHIPGHVTQLLDQLSKPIIRWRELLRQYLGRHVGNRRKTFSRANRRYQSFGMKGVSHHAASTVVVIVDTSGSIGTGELEQFFAEIEAVSYRSKVFVLQWDAEFQGYDKYRRGDWRKIQIRGRGGTDMAAPFDWLDENGLQGNVAVMLTDGYTNWSTKDIRYPVITVITTDQKGPPYGHVIHMKAYE